MELFRALAPLMMVCILLASGCVNPWDNEVSPVGKLNPETQSSHVTPTVQASTVVMTTAPMTTAPVITPVIPPVLLRCPERENDTYWIALDPIGDLTRGAQEIVRGETNIPAGDTIELVLYESAFHPHCKCCFDDELRTLVKVHKGPGCNNTLSFFFDSSNLRPQEYVMTSRYSEETQINSRIFTVFKNYTKTSVPGTNLPSDLTVNTTLTLNPVWDVKQGEMLVITGYTGKPDYAIQYSIHDNRYTAADCRYSCPAELVHGTMYANAYGQVPQPFSFRLNTSDFNTGRYVVSLNAPCSGESAEKVFTIVS